VFSADECASDLAVTLSAKSLPVQEKSYSTQWFNLPRPESIGPPVIQGFSPKYPLTLNPFTPKNPHLLWLSQVTDLP
jgi:hypothetical protein